MTRVAYVTIVHGRADHLAAQRRALASNGVSARDHIVVAMDDPTVLGADAIVPRTGSGLPLARARNTGARLALDGGADVLVFLDVDCIPGTDLTTLYGKWASDGVVLCGPVTYLPRGAGTTAAELAERTDPHAARPNPPYGTIERGSDWNLFWSLSFAVTADTWRRIGGFCEDYTGYGGEDTDFGRLAERSGAVLRWIGGAHAYHQWHPVSSPPVEHLEDIVTNAAIFHRRWGTWPMEGWLSAFADRGSIRWDPAAPTIETCPAP